MAILEITKEQADKLLSEKYGFYGDKNFKGSYNGGKYIAQKGKKYWECSKLSEAAISFRVNIGHAPIFIC